MRNNNIKNTALSNRVEVYSITCNLDKTDHLTTFLRFLLTTLVY